MASTTLTAAPRGVTDPLQILLIYSQVFLQIGLVTAVIAVIMILAVPALCRMINREDSQLHMQKSKGVVS